MQSSPILASRSKPSLKIIVNSPTIQCYMSDSNMRSPLPLLSPTALSGHLDSNDRFRSLMSPKSSTQPITFLDYKQKVLNKLNKLEEKWKANNIFCKELNTLRKNTLEKISLHKQKTLKKKLNVQSARNIIGASLPPIYKCEEINKNLSKRKILEELEREIMHSPINPSITQPEQKEQQSISDFLAFVYRLNGEERKKYVVGEVEVVRLGPRKVL